MQAFRSLAVIAALSACPGVLSAAPARSIDQGPAWTPALQKKFYSQDQGSRLMPMSWMNALRQPDGEPFMADSLSRYGYLRNENDHQSNLPVGFTVAGPNGAASLGMTCAACHTREIDVDGERYRIDGGPAFADFYSFVADLDMAVASVIDGRNTFQAFAGRVLGRHPTMTEAARLLLEVKAWYERYHTEMSRSLPVIGWGPARLDAVGMIFDRLTGLDLGPPPSHLIPANIQTADAPARYPFLWNAAIQDFTQWPGFAANGDNLLGLARNLGEVYGVFGTFFPRQDPDLPAAHIDYISENSANFAGLGKLERLIRDIGPPKYQWPIDQALARQGEAIFVREQAQGGCAEGHGIAPGKTRPGEQKTWATPILDVGTDTREVNLLSRTAQSGVLAGAGLGQRQLQPTDAAIAILGAAVGGAILQNSFPPKPVLQQASQHIASEPPANPAEMMQEFQTAFTPPAAPTEYKYEARVLQGIWAAAPYLHNGSVPTLTDLLKPATQRPASFMVGPNYDPVNVGLAVSQTHPGYTLVTTDCTNRNSGDSRCGHEFGTTTLTDGEKRALLEYLKTL